MNTSITRLLPGRAARLVPLVLASGGLALLAGCGSGPDTHVVSAPPPAPPTQVIVQSQPAPQTQVVAATPTANGTYIVTQAPPAVPQQQVVVTRPAQPTSDHVWIEGHWTWRNERYEWVDSHWELPPSHGATWVPPRWERRSDGDYTFYEGYWE